MMGLGVLAAADKFDHMDDNEVNHNKDNRSKNNTTTTITMQRLSLSFNFCITINIPTIINTTMIITSILMMNTVHCTGSNPGCSNAKCSAPTDGLRWRRPSPYWGSPAGLLIFSRFICLL